MGDHPLAFYASLIMFGLLLVAYSSLKPEYSTVSSLSSADIGRRVAVEGVISSKYALGGNVFLSLGTDSGELGAVMFKSSIHDRMPYLLMDGAAVRAFGEVSLHGGALQLVVDSLEAIG